MKSIEGIQHALSQGAQVERIGKPSRIEYQARFARRLRFELPEQYWSLLRFADGLMNDDQELELALRGGDL